MFCDGVGVKDNPSFKTLILLLLSGTLDIFHTLMETGSRVYYSGPGSFFGVFVGSCYIFILRLFIQIL